MISIWYEAIWWKQLLLIVAGVLLVAFLGLLLARLMKSIRYESIWWKQLLLIVAGGLLVAFVGSLLVCPTGPGSGRIGFALLAAYALLLLLLGPKFTKITGFVLLCIFLAAFAIETRSKNRYAEKLRGRARGMQALKKGNYDLAIACFTQAIKVNPKNASAYARRAAAYIEKKEYDKAIADYDEVIRLDPKDAFAYYQRGFAYYDKGEYDKAWDDVHKAQSLGFEVPQELLNSLRQASRRNE